MPEENELVRGATLSPCGTYRYHLYRQVSIERENMGRVAFVMLNPSTADAEKDDPTIRKCMKYARSWGYEWLDVVNLFAFRATDPKLLKVSVQDPIGLPQNDEWLARCLKGSQLVVAAWGPNGSLLARGKFVREFFRVNKKPLHYLKLGKHGDPYHPLYQKDDLRPTEWDPQ